MGFTCLDDTCSHVWIIHIVLICYSTNMMSANGVSRKGDKYSSLIVRGGGESMTGYTFTPVWPDILLPLA